MGYLTLAEAAIQTGYSVELLEKLQSYSPKNDGRKLVATKIGDLKHVKDTDLEDFVSHLNAPWEKPEQSQRPYIPAYICADVKAECHFECAICGSMDNGEVAHIVAVADSLNNSPDNLILLCPNHHTEYDFGFKPSSNISAEVIKSAKAMKRNARRRMLRYEANVVELLKSTLKVIEKLQAKLEEASSAEEILIYKTEITALLKTLPDAHEKAIEAAKTDQPAEKFSNLLVAIAPTLSKLDNVDENNVEEIVDELTDDCEDDLLDIDEVDCPHCNAYGLTGKVGDLCSFCRGSCYVSTAKAETYDSDNIDEVDCPHCNGRGLTGLVGFYCSYCRGSCVVTRTKADNYDPETLDEVDCPHCGGSGRTGLAGYLCNFCQGGCVVSRAMAEAYDEETIDEVECPHCDGSGQRRGYYCIFCQGGSVVTREKAESYDAEDVDERDCPHCDGSGTIGIAGHPCSVCHGSGLVRKETAENYDPEQVDDVECPHCDARGYTGSRDCHCSYCQGRSYISSEKADQYDVEELDLYDCPRCDGSGETGRVGDTCALCKGAGEVSSRKREAYLEKYGS